MQIAVIGSNMIDLVSYVDRMPELGETLAGNDFAMGHGGKGANQAVAASRLGSSVRMLTRVGDDTFANDTIANFEREGIDTRWVLRTEGPSGVAPIFVDAQSRNSIVIVPGANMSLTAADITDAADDLAQCRLIVLQLEVPLETVYAAIEFGTARDIPVLLNPAPAHPDLDLTRITGATFFIPNETELALLTDKPVESLDQVRELPRACARPASPMSSSPSVSAERCGWLRASTNWSRAKRCRPLIRPVPGTPSSAASPTSSSSTATWPRPSPPPTATPRTR